MRSFLSNIALSDVLAGENYDYKKYIIIGAVAVVLIVAMVIITIISKKKNK